MSKMRKGLMGAAIFAIVFVVFLPNIRNSFIRFDDFEYVVRNAWITNGLTPRSVWWSFRSAGYASNWHPLTWMSHAADITVADALHLPWRTEKNDQMVFVKVKCPLATLAHLENVVLHAANAVLLWILMMLVAGRGHEDDSPFLPSIAAFLTLLWALHPLRVEVVAWVSERKELLSVFFMLLTMITYVRGRGRRSRSTVESANSILDLLSPPTFFFFILALLAKPVAVSLPVVLVAYDWLLDGKRLREAVSRNLFFILAAVGVCWMTMSSQTLALHEGQKWSRMTQLLCVVEAPVVYLLQSVFPFGLSPDYAVPTWESWPFFVAGILLLMGMGAVAVVHLVRPTKLTGILSFGIAWVYVGLLPMIGIVKVGYEPHSDRYTYWIGCGFVICLLLLVRRMKIDWTTLRRPAAYVSAAVLLLLSVLTVYQSSLWKDTKTLFSYVVSRTHDELFANMLAEEYVREGGEGFKRAEEMLRDTLQVKKSATARAALALHLASFCDGKIHYSFTDGKTEGFPEVRILASYAIEDGGRDDWAYAALGFADYREGKYKSAYENMKKAIDAGFESPIRIVKLDEWKKKADVQKQ